MRAPKASRQALAVLGKLERALDGAGRAGRALEDAIHAAQLASRGECGEGGFSTFEDLPADPLTDARVHRVIHLLDTHAHGFPLALRTELSRAREHLAQAAPDEVARRLASEATPREGS
jgi:hypothetical protein